MSLTLHLVMLAAPIVIAAGCIAARPGHGEPWGALKGVLPCMVLGLFSSLLMSLPITRLHRLTFTERVIWFDGEKVEIRPAD